MYQQQIITNGLIVSYIEHNVWLKYIISLTIDDISS